MHTPGEDMRIALRRPDGSWHISDSLAPFRPAGVNDLDVHPSPSASISECSLIQPSKDWEIKKVGCESGYGFSTITLPPPAYTRHSYGDQSSQTSVWYTHSFPLFYFRLDLPWICWCSFLSGRIFLSFSLVRFLALPFKLRTLTMNFFFPYKLVDAVQPHRWGLYFPWSQGTTYLWLFSMYNYFFLHERC